MKSEQDLDNYHTYMNRHNLTHFIPEAEIRKMPNTTVIALSGNNTKYEPTADLGVNQDRYFTAHFI